MRAFSLVELSIVLVILGLLTGGILAGQSLIRAAEIRSITTEYNRWMTATQTFRDKYMALPGDMNNAVMFWNRQVNQAWCLPTSGATVTTPGTCNGNGDGMVNNPGGASQSGERFQFWRQLAFAGLIEGTYSGIAGTAGANHTTVNDNVPSSRISNVGWEIGWIGNHAGAADSFAGAYGNRFVVGTSRPNAGQWDAFLSPEEAWNIDTKTDDGKPATGRILAAVRNTCTISTGPTDYAATYNLTDTAKGCGLYYLSVF